MTTDTLIILSGAFVAVLPFLGFPNSWDRVLFFIAGMFVISLGIVVRRGRHTTSNAASHNPHFVEHVPTEAARSTGHEEN
jgi:hypothetical protein